MKAASERIKVFICLEVLCVYYLILLTFSILNKFRFALLKVTKAAIRLQKWIINLFIGYTFVTLQITDFQNTNRKKVTKVTKVTLNTGFCFRSASVVTFPDPVWSFRCLPLSLMSLAAATVSLLSIRCILPIKNIR